VSNIFNFTKTYQHVIAKDLYQRINKLLNDRKKYNARLLEMGLCDGTSRYWKAVAATELSTKEIELFVSRAVELDEQTDYLSHLTQDRFKFIDKYEKVHQMIVDAKKAKKI